jgi:hypothetical protein
MAVRDQVSGVAGEAGEPDPRQDSPAAKYFDGLILCVS